MVSLRAKKMGRRQKACLAMVSAGAALLYVTDSVPAMSGAPKFGRSAMDSAASLVRRALSVQYDTTQTLPLPSFYDNYANVWDTVIDQDQPFFWYIPKSGGNTLGKIFSFCLEMVSCSPMAIEVPDDSLVINLHNDGGKYLNVDPSTTAGIQKAVEFNVAQSQAADVLISHRLSEAAPIFSPTSKARLFVMLRNPVKRIVDLFYYKQRATWEPSFDSAVATMTLKEFAESDKHVANFVTRSLLNHPTEELTPEDVTLAKDILRRKFIVGIMEFKSYEKSVVRFEQYFGWWDEYSVLTNSTINYCHYKKISAGDHFGRHPTPNADAVAVIAARNWADIEIFMYAKNVLFPMQSTLIS